MQAKEMANAREDPATFGALHHWLTDETTLTATPEALAAKWSMTRILVVCANAARHAKNPNMPAKIRGAWGRALAAGASTSAVDDGQCGWEAPCAYDIFFNVQGRLTARLEIPKPYVLNVEAVEADLHVTLTLFGIAGNWAGEAADALVRALRGGIDSGSRRDPLRVTGRAIDAAEGLPEADLSHGAVLRFMSPVALRAGEDRHADPAAMITSLANRISGLARWHGVRLDVDPSELKAEAILIGALAEWDGAKVQNWRRSSKAQGRAHDMGGVTGELWLPAVTRPVAALLSMGAECHVGGRTALGMGRYALLGVRM